MTISILTQTRDFSIQQNLMYVSSFSRQGLNIGYSKTLFLYTFGYRALLARCNFRKRCDISV